MTISRRGFLGSILAACAAPAIVRADSLMQIVPTDAAVMTGTEVLAYQDNMARALQGFNQEEYDAMIRAAVRRLADGLERDFLHALTRGSVVTVAGIHKPRSRELQQFIVQ